MQKLKKIIADILDIEESAVHDDISSSTVESWDSFNTLLIASEIDRVFSVKLTMEEIANMKSVGAIKTLLKKRGVELAHA